MHWCILRTSAARTLKLAASLGDAGLEAWTPIGVASRAGRGRERRAIRETPVAITPTFVFAPAEHAAELLTAAKAFASPHPPFSVFKHRDRVPLIRASSLQPLREEVERQHLSQRKRVRRTPRVGSLVTLDKGAFAGMTGVVERGDGKAASVNFGGGFVVEIATYLLPDDVLCGTASAAFGLAA